MLYLRSPTCAKLTYRTLPSGCILALAHLVMVTDPSAPSAPAAVVPLGLAGYVLPLFTNAVATTLIVYRLLTTTRHAIRAKSANADAEDAERCEHDGDDRERGAGRV